MYAIFHESKAIIFPNINEDQLDFAATCQQSDAYEVEKLGFFLNNWLTLRNVADIHIDSLSPSMLSATLSRTFRLAPAAGGIVFTGTKLVCIQRNGIPDLPKGHIESGETPDNAALREVHEETGIEGLHLAQKLPTTWHCYDWHGEWRLKATYWYAMYSDGNCTLKPQTEEGIESVTLIDKAGLAPFFENTFRSIRDVLEKDIRKLMDTAPLSPPQI